MIGVYPSPLIEEESPAAGGEDYRRAPRTLSSQGDQLALSEN